MNVRTVDTMFQLESRSIHRSKQIHDVSSRGLTVIALTAASPFNTPLADTAPPIRSRLTPADTSIEHYGTMRRVVAPVGRYKILYRKQTVYNIITLTKINHNRYSDVEAALPLLPPTINCMQTDVNTEHKNTVRFRGIRILVQATLSRNEQNFEVKSNRIQSDVLVSREFEGCVAV